MHDEAADGNFFPTVFLRKACEQARSITEMGFYLGLFGGTLTYIEQWGRGGHLRRWGGSGWFLENR